MGERQARSEEATFVGFALLLIVLLGLGWSLRERDIIRQESMQYVTVDNADGVRNSDTFFPQQALCMVWPAARVRTTRIDDTFVREVLSNSSTHGASCPEGTQYHETERW